MQWFIHCRVTFSIPTLITTATQVSLSQPCQTVSGWGVKRDSGFYNNEQKNEETIGKYGPSMSRGIFTESSACVYVHFQSGVMFVCVFLLLQCDHNLHDIIVFMLDVWAFQWFGLISFVSVSKTDKEEKNVFC